jgi:hypothetical protein
LKRIGNVLSFASTLLLAVVLLQATAARLKHEVSAALGVTGAPASNPAGTKQSVTFAQITDAHIFDDGWKAQGSEPYRQAIDNRTALHWAIDAINARAEKTGIDFVVYTGDFGLQNVFFSDRGCSAVPFKSEPGLPPFSFEMAAEELAIELDRLLVHDVYVVPGNNDIIAEQVEDYPRFECFISQLQTDLQKLPGHIHVEELRTDRVISAGSFRLAGMNTASFKDAKNYAKECNISLPAASATLDQGCPVPQMQALQGLLSASETSPLLLFTHVPDLIDPYTKLPSWDIDPKTRADWLQQAAKPQLVGVFAGHFHSNLHRLYANNSGTKVLFMDVRDGEKTWVAPPLAGKNQRDGQPQARGFMVLKVDASAGKLDVKATPVWYPGAEPVVIKGEHTMSQQCFFLLTVLVIVIAGCFGGVLNHLLNKTEKNGNPDPDELSFAAKLVLGIGAAFLVPLFLQVIDSDLVTIMHCTVEKGPNYSKVLVFGGFCLVASMSARSFITSVSERVMRKAEKAERVLDEVKQLVQQVLQRLESQDESGGGTSKAASDQRPNENPGSFKL